MAVDNTADAWRWTVIKMIDRLFSDGSFLDCDDSLQRAGDFIAEAVRRELPDLSVATKPPPPPCQRSALMD